MPYHVAFHVGPHYLPNYSFYESPQGYESSMLLVYIKLHVILTLPRRKFFKRFLSSADFFSKSTFSKSSFRIPSGCQTDRIHIRPDISSGLIWVQSFCKGYQQTTLVGNQLILNQQMTLVGRRFEVNMVSHSSLLSRARLFICWIYSIVIYYLRFHHERKFIGS